MSKLCTAESGPQPHSCKKPFADDAIAQLLARIEDAAAAQRIRELQVMHQALTTHRRAWSHYADWDSAAAAQAGQAALEALAALEAKPLDQIRLKRTRVRKPIDEPAFDWAQIEQVDLFADPERWPHKPYCSLDPEQYGSKIRSFLHAITHPYIQANPPHLRVWSIQDIDRAGAATAWEDAGLPAPAWTCVNRSNGHAHMAWGLRAPVLVSGLGARDAPLRYLVAIEAMMRAALGADESFVNVLTKNPGHSMWHTLRGPRVMYDLSELAEHLPGLEKFIPKRGRVDTIGLGRNVTLFDTLRVWAYRSVRKHWGGGLGGWNAWMSECNSRALVMNCDLFAGRELDPREVWHIARSVGRYVWREFTPEGFSKAQARAGRRGGVASGLARATANEDKRTSARLMAAQGCSTRQIAAVVGVNQSTVTRWLSGVMHEAISDNSPRASLPGPGVPPLGGAETGFSPSGGVR